MPHEMTDLDTMVSGSNITPWHRHPNARVIEGAATVDDALVLAGLDWEVEKRPLFFPDAGPYDDIDADDVGSRAYPDRFAVVRKDINLPLAIVSDIYQEVQNRDGLAFLQVLLDGGDVQIETAGSLKGCRIVYICARLDRDLLVAGESLIPYIVFSTSHDGTMGIGVTAGPVRPVCWNTLMMMFAQAKARWSTRHTQHVGSRIAVARDSLALTWRYYDEFEKEVAALSAAPAHRGTVELVAGRVFGLRPDTTDPVGRVRYDRRLDTILDRYEADPAVDTRWGVLNAFNGYELWDRQTRDPNAAIERQAINTLRATQPITVGAQHALYSVAV